MAGESDEVRAQVEAVEHLANAVRSFADQMRLVADNAEKQMRHRTRQIEAEVQQRQRTLREARRATRRAEDALSRCRENCESLVRAVDEARRRETEAERSVARATRAAAIVEQASAAINAAARSAQHVVSAHGQGAIAACAELAERLKGYLSSRQFADHVLTLSGTIAAVAQAGTEISSMTSYTATAPPPCDIATVRTVDREGLQTLHGQYADNESRLKSQEECSDREPD